MKNSTLIRKLLSARTFVICNEAKSHSVTNRVIDIDKKPTTVDEHFQLMKRWSDLK